MQIFKGFLMMLMHWQFIRSFNWTEPVGKCMALIARQDYEPSQLSVLHHVYVHVIFRWLYSRKYIKVLYKSS